MGLFSRFSFADAPHKGPPMSERPPGIYSPILGQMGAPEALQGPRQLPPMQAQATPTMPKKKGLFGGWKAPDENGISKWDRVGLLGASLRDDPSVAPAMMQALQGQSELAMKRQAAQAKSQQQAQLLAMADKLGMDDREKVLFLANPNEWAKANASRFEAYTLAPGSKRGVGGQTVDYAPQFMEVGDQVGRTTQDGGFEGVFTRNPTFSETETAQNNAFGRDLRGREFDWQRQYQGGMLGVARQNAGTSAFSAQTGRKAYEARLKGLGGFGTPGVGGVIGPTLDPNEWEPVQ